MEAASYALLRRLAPVLRHNMAGALQPVSMMSTMLERRLKKPDPDIAALAMNSSQLNALAREASDDLMGLMTWLAPKANDLVTLVAGVGEAAGLVTTELSFRGFTVINQVDVVQVELLRSVTRNVFMAAVIAMTDATTAPANVILASQLGDNELVLTISIQPLQGEALQGGALPYRKLEWEDVQALAEVESVKIVHTAHRVELHCPAKVAMV